MRQHTNAITLDARPPTPSNVSRRAMSREPPNPLLCKGFSVVTLPSLQGVTQPPGTAPEPHALTGDLQDHPRRTRVQCHLDDSMAGGNCSRTTYFSALLSFSSIKSAGN